VPFPYLEAGHEVLALEAPRRRAGRKIGKRNALAREHDVEPVAPLRCRVVPGAVDVGGRHVHDLDVVTGPDPAHPLDPPVIKLPVAGELGDVLDHHGGVAVDLGGPDHIQSARPGALVGVGRDVAKLLQVELALTVMFPVAPGGAYLGANYRRPQHIGMGEAPHVVVVDVGAEELGVPVIAGHSLDRPRAVVRSDDQLEVGVHHAGDRAASPAEQVGEGGAHSTTSASTMSAAGASWRSGALISPGPPTL